MADNGVRTTNLPLSTERPKTVLAHVDEGGVEVVRRQSIEIFVQYLLGLAGLDPSGVADLSQRLTAEITRATAADNALGARLDALALALSAIGKVEMLTDRYIGGIYYKYVWVDDAYAPLLGFTDDRKVLIPGTLETSRDGVYAAELGFSTANGTISNFLGARADGKRTWIRGWEPSLGLPTICHIPGLSQSTDFNADGNLITLPNDQMLGARLPRRGYRTWVDAPAAAASTLNRGPGAWILDNHVDKPVSATGQSPIPGFTVKFKAALVGGRYASADLSEMAPYLVFTNANRGERFLSELGPDGAFGHFTTWVDDVRRVATEAKRLGFSYGMPQINFNEGESESNGQLDRGGPFLGFTALKVAYGDRIVAYHQIYQNAAKAAAAEVGMPLPARPIPLMITQTAYVRSAEAQRYAALKSRDIFIVATTYQGPSGLNGEQDYLDPNGNRITGRGARVHFDADTQLMCLGEQRGKNSRRVIFEGKKRIIPDMTDAVRVTNTKVLVKIFVLFPPLQFEKRFLPNVAHRGFQVRLGTPDAPGAYLTVLDVEIVGEAVMIALDPSTPLLAGQAAFVIVGDVIEVRTTTVNVASVSTTGTRANGQPAVQLVFNGDQRGHFADVSIQGAFDVDQPGIGKGMSVFEVNYDATANTTTLVGEQRLYTGPMQPGLPLLVKRDRTYCTLCDSDPEASVYSFMAPWSGMRGEPFPPNNFLLFGVQTIRT